MLAGTFPYDAATVDYDDLARRIGATEPDVLFVSAYLDDGVALRRATIRQGVRLLASIGTSSSYCHPAFGDALGDAAVGLFASDKPDGPDVNEEALTPDARAALRWATAEYEDRWGEAMSAPALTGFAHACALFTDVLPTASSLGAADVAAAALRTKIPVGATRQRQRARPRPARRGRRGREPQLVGGDLGVGGTAHPGGGVAGRVRDAPDRSHPDPMTARAVRLGGLVALAYVATLVITMQLSGRHVRPLFEGVGPSAPYNWVDPPPEFAASNVEPSSATVDIPIGADGTGPAGPATPDGQLVLAMPSGAIAPHPPDTSVEAALTPLSPADFADVPEGLRPDGNVYRVELTYEPSGTAVSRLAEPGNVILVVPEAAESLLFSTDGDAWTILETQQVGGAAATTVGARLEAPGLYLAAAPPAAPTETSRRADDAGSVLATAAATAGLALVLGYGPALVRRVRRRR